MANEQDKRVDAEQKEAAPVIPSTGEHNLFTEKMDTEIAADTWMGAVLNPDASKPDGNISYDPRTQTERYEGSVDTPDAQGTAADNGAEAEQVARANRVADTAHERTDVGVADYETSTEIAPPLQTDGTRGENEENRQRSQWDNRADNEADAGSGLGWIGLGASILSLFLLPYLMAPVGIVLGYLAFRRNARTLGTWAMIIGALAILGALLFAPFFTAR
ncbi:MAG: hypothetical protein H0Z34_08595 [Brevibacillus sp.]|nr:hypothetical protein [Brevibacillus sp.]